MIQDFYYSRSARTTYPDPSTTEIWRIQDQIGGGGGRRPSACSSGGEQDADSSRVAAAAAATALLRTGGISSRHANGRLPLANNNNVYCEEEEEEGEHRYVMKSLVMGDRSAVYPLQPVGRSLALRTLRLRGRSNIPSPLLS